MIVLLAERSVVATCLELSVGGKRLHPPKFTPQPLAHDSGDSSPLSTTSSSNPPLERSERAFRPVASPGELGYPDEGLFLQTSPGV